MNKQFFTLLLCLLGSLPGFSQNIVEPEIIRWDTSTLQLGSTLLYRDTSLMLIGSDVVQGQFIGQLNDSLEVVSKVYVNSNLGVTAAAYRFGSYYVGGIRATGSGPNIIALAMDRITEAGVKEASGRANLEGIFDYALGITPTRDSGAVVFGMGGPPRVINLCKFDRAGGILWNKKIALSSDCYANDVLELDNGDFFVTGQASGSPKSIRGAIMLKFNESGDSLWASNFSIPGASGKRIFQSPKGHLFICGTTYKSTTVIVGRPYLYLAQVDTTGTMQWEVTYDRFIGDSTVLEFIFEDVQPTSDGGVIFLATAITYDGATTGEHPYLLKVDSHGQYQWHKVIIPTTGDNASGGKVLPLRNGTYALLLLGKPQVGNPYMIYALLGPDGTFTEVDAIRQALAFTASPNPATDRVELSWTQTTSGETEIRLLDVQGRLLTRSSAMHAAGSARSEISLSAYPDGIYFVEIISGGKQGSMKLVKRY